MSILRKAGIVLVVLCTVAMILPSTAAAIEEPDNWGDPVFNYTSNPQADADPPGDLEAAFINYNSAEDTVQFRINFTDDAPDNPMSDNITQIYLDADTDSTTGLNNKTFTDGGDAEAFYNNTDNIGAEYRVSVGDQTGVIAEWEESVSQFLGSESESVSVEKRSDSVITEIPRSDLGNTETIDLKFVYLDTSNEVKGQDKETYTWAPDANDAEINSTRFGINPEEGTGSIVPQATINAIINISDDPVADDATVTFEVEDDSGEITEKQPEEIDGNSNITESFIVDAGNFNGDGTLRAEIDGENYTLDKETSVSDSGGLDENSVVEKIFQPHGLINISGTVSGLSTTEGGSFTMSVNESSISDETINFDGTSDEELYSFDPVNATKLTDGGSVEASLSVEGDSAITNDTDTTFQTSRFNSADKNGIDFTVNPAGQTLDLIANQSEVDVLTDSAFNLTVIASSDSENGEGIDSVEHVIEYDSTQLSIVNNETLVSGTGNSTSEIQREGEYEVGIYSDSSNTVITQGGQASLYNLTFKIDSSVDPLEGETVDVTPTTNSDKTDMLNVSNTDMGFDTDGTSVSVTNSETRIEDLGPTTTHLTADGVMIGSPVKFAVSPSTSNEGEIDRIVLYNNRTDTKNDSVSYDNVEGPFDARLTDDSPADTTYQGSGSYQERQVYNITVYPNTNGDEKTIEQTVNIYKRGDVNTDGSVTTEDITDVLENRNKEAEGGLPWSEADTARYDVNNDGVIDIVDVTAVTEQF